MYTLVRSLTTIRLAVEQVAALMAAWLIAELFYKFHSFTLELAAFLATWLLLDWLVQALAPRLLARQQPPAS
jgi:hypothetical protein